MALISKNDNHFTTHFMRVNCVGKFLPNLCDIFDQENLNKKILTRLIVLSKLVEQLKILVNL